MLKEISPYQLANFIPLEYIHDYTPPRDYDRTARLLNRTVTMLVSTSWRSRAINHNKFVACLLAFHRMGIPPFQISIILWKAARFAGIEKPFIPSGTTIGRYLGEFIARQPKNAYDGLAEDVATYLEAKEREPVWKRRKYEMPFEEDCEE